MSYERCEKHSTDATNGCPFCVLERRTLLAESCADALIAKIRPYCVRRLEVLDEPVLEQLLATLQRAP